MSKLYDYNVTGYDDDKLHMYLNNVHDLLQVTMIYREVQAIYSRIISKTHILPAFHYLTIVTP